MSESKDQQSENRYNPTEAEIKKAIRKRKRYDDQKKILQLLFDDFP